MAKKDGIMKPISGLGFVIVNILFVETVFFPKSLVFDILLPKLANDG